MYDISTDKVRDLTAQWYALISGAHHKDHDCHFYITTKFSYDGKLTYSITHYAYIGREIDEEYPTYPVCLKALEDYITALIAEEKEKSAVREES